MEGLDACDECMAHSGSRSAQTPLCAGVLAGASTTALTSALRYSAAPRAALSIEFLRRAEGLDLRGVAQTAGQALRRAIALCRLDGTARRPGPELHSRCSSAEPMWAQGGAFSAFVPCSTGREPTANGRAAQETVRARQLCTSLATVRFLHDLLLALIARHEAGSVLEMGDSLTCMDFGVQGSNVRHERRAKGCEAAFGTSARWRG